MADKSTGWGGGGKMGKSFPKDKKNAYDSQRDTNERTMHYGPLWIHRGIRQAAGPLKSQDQVNP